MSFFRSVILLLTPRWQRAVNRFKNSKRDRLRTPFLAALVIALWAVIYVVFVKALAYFTAEEMFGTIAATKLLSMLLMTFAFVLVISNIITTFSSYYLSADLELIMAGPVPAKSLYSARFIETLGDSSWMVLVFGFPVFLAYGRVFSAPWIFYLLSFVTFFCLLSLVTSLSILIVQNLVRTFPVRRLRDLFVLVGILVFIGVYLIFRMIRPEEFLNPEGFASVMDYLSIMSESSSPFLPTTWLMFVLKPYITGYGHDQIPYFLALLVLAALAAFRLAGHNHELVHFVGYSKAMESKGARLSKSRTVAAFSRVLNAVLDPPTSRLVIKETLLMARDWGRLSQLLLLLALILVYLYNFSVIPSLDSPEATMGLKSIVAFLNIGLAGFVLASLGVRFLFPAISSEGRAFWILKGSPIALRRILWVKFFFYLVPMLILGLLLVIATNWLLGLGTFMFVLCTATVALLTMGITSLSIGMGVLYADFKETDPNQAFAGFGGLLTMLYAALGVAAVILLEAYPVYKYLLAQFFHKSLRVQDYFFMGAWFMGALVVAIFLMIQPMRSGLKHITRLEI
jgi:ABC-2 type transport system permease protein